jgi:hypothetical protein
MPTSTNTPTPTDTPTPTPIPVPTSDVPSSQPGLLIGVLVLTMGGTAVAADMSKRRRPAQRPVPVRSPRPVARRQARRSRPRTRRVRVRWDALMPAAAFAILVAVLMVLVVVSRTWLAWGR